MAGFGKRNPMCIQPFYIEEPLCRFDRTVCGCPLRSFVPHFGQDFTISGKPMCVVDNKDEVNRVACLERRLEVDFSLLVAKAGPNSFFCRSVNIRSSFTFD
jgi:hypothetical protein